MASDPVRLLKEVAERVGRRVRKTNLFDANICAGAAPPDRPWEIVAPPGEIFRHKLNITFAGCKVTLYANRKFVAANIPANLDVEVFSANRRDKIITLKRSTLELPGFPSLPVFSGSSGDELKDLLRSKAVSRVLRALGLGEAESLHVYRGGLLFYFQPESSERLLSAVEALCRFAQELPAFTEDVSVEDLPPALKQLSAWLREWAISDDELRSEMLEQKSPEELKKFIAAVEPEFEAIDDYLSSFGDEPLSEAAIALNSLAECAAEAKLVVGPRWRPPLGQKPSRYRCRFATDGDARLSPLRFRSMSDSS
jgi:hypothetical protein